LDSSLGTASCLERDDIAQDLLIQVETPIRGNTQRLSTNQTATIPRTNKISFTRSLLSLRSL